MLEEKSSDNIIISSNIKKEDEETLQTKEKIIEKEKLRQEDGLELIASENYVSLDVLEAVGSILTKSLHQLIKLK